MLMHIKRVFLLIFLLNLFAYGQSCENEEYIRYHSINFNLSFIHKGFVSPQSKECETSSETYLYNKNNEKTKPILIKDGVIGIKEYGANIIAIDTFAGAHNRRLYFLKKVIIDKNFYPFIYKLEPIIIDNNSSFFSSNTGMISVFEDFTKKNENLEVHVFNLNRKRDLEVNKYLFSFQEIKFFSQIENREKGK